MDIMGGSGWLRCWSDARDKVEYSCPYVGIFRLGENKRQEWGDVFYIQCV